MISRYNYRYIIRLSIDKAMAKKNIILIIRYRHVVGHNISIYLWPLSVIVAKFFGASLLKLTLTLSTI